MAKTDNPIKRLFRTYIDEIAPSLLPHRKIHRISPNDVTLPVSSFVSDGLFTLELQDGSEILLHLEFEAYTSAKDMPFRMLEYRSRLAYTYRVEVLSVVFYIGSAGRGDTGSHCLGDSLTWSYDVVRLEQLSSEELLATNSLPWIALMGLSKVKSFDDLLKGLDRIRGEADNRKKRVLYDVFLSLIPSKEVYKMLEEALEKDDFFLTLDTPYVQKLKALGREEGREEGHLEKAREMVNEILLMRFQMSDEVKGNLGELLGEVKDEAKLNELFRKAVKAEAIESYLTELQKFVASNQGS